MLHLLSLLLLGSSLVLSGRALAVANGSLTTDDFYDPIVVFADGTPAGFGSGLLIHDEWVLTAAHVADLFLGAPSPIVGFDASSPTNPSQVRTVVDAIVHPSWTGPGAFAFDVGLLRLAAPATGFATIPLVDETAFDVAALMGQPVTWTGWGGLTSGSFGLSFGVTALSDVTPSGGSLLYVNSHPFIQIVPGDSGGPLLAATPLGFGALGLNSFASPGASFAVGIGSHRAFIDAHVPGVAWLGAPVPEPGTALLLGAGLAALARRPEPVRPPV